MTELKTIDSTALTTSIGLEIHVQLKTKSKMFCQCDNNAQNKAPNTVVCPVCLGYPGVLPKANKQAILWTIKTGLALNCKINKTAKFDRKHYFYPDLPKGYQISQYDLPFAAEGQVELKAQGKKLKADEKSVIRVTRVHLEEDAGKLIHPSRDRAETGSDGKSLVDLNRAGTPLMEIVTEPDITSPEQAGDFLRLLQKIVRDEVAVSDANMEKGHLRCDANISVCDEKGLMSGIVELKNINSFRFIEKALAIEEQKLKDQYPNWPKEKTKSTHGYDSKKNITFVQRQKEEAADYRYFPEPDLPPFDANEFDLLELKGAINAGEDSIIEKLIEDGVKEKEAKILAANKNKISQFSAIRDRLDDKSNKYSSLLAKVIVHFGLNFKDDSNKMKEYGLAFVALGENKILKNTFIEIIKKINQENISFGKALVELGGEQIENKKEIEDIIENVLTKHPNEVKAYKEGKRQLIGFFVGLVMKETGGRANPGLVNKILAKKLEN